MSAPASFSAFLVDDEPLCRADFRQVLRSFPEVRLLGEAETLSAAERFLKKQTVDLLFLDISVGRENALDWLQTFSQQPWVIALTAHAQHAARGFALNLVDYILKPVEEERLRAALEKARHLRASAPLLPGRVTFLAELDGKKTTFDLAEILGAESMGNYVLLHTRRGKAVKRATFKDVRAKLAPPLFIETGRGRVVALSHVKAWARNTKGKLQLELADQTSVLVSQSLAPTVTKLLKTKSDA